MVTGGEFRRKTKLMGGAGARLDCTREEASWL